MASEYTVDVTIDVTSSSSLVNPVEISKSDDFSILSQDGLIEGNVKVVADSTSYIPIPFGALSYIQMLMIITDYPVKLFLNGTTGVDAIPIHSAFLDTFGDSNNDGKGKITSAYLRNDGNTRATCTIRLCGKE
jgi:hypothetical protein